MKEPTLTNFNAPVALRNRFDEVCRASGRTRTSVLVELMENYTLSQGKVLATRNAEIQQVDQVLEESRRMMSFKEFLSYQARRERIAGHSRSDSDFGPPSMFMSDGHGDW